MTNLSAVARNGVAFSQKLGLFNGLLHVPNSTESSVGVRGFEQVFVPHGATLVTQGAKAECVFYILRGWALEEELNSDGDVVWANILMRGDVAGLGCSMLESDREVPRLTSTASISAVTDVFALRVPRNKISRSMEEDSSFSKMVQDVLWHQADRLHAHMVTLSAKCAHDRVTAMLRSFYDRALNAGAFTDARRLPISQVILARVANISVVHMNRIAQKLRQDGFLEWSADGVLLFS
jgi:CRP-like cAMP-binding protein